MKKIINTNQIIQKTAKYFCKIASKEDLLELNNFCNKIDIIFLKSGMPKVLLNKILNLSAYLNLSDINKSIIKILVENKCLYLISKLCSIIENLTVQKIIIYHTNEFKESDFKSIIKQINDYNASFKHLKEDEHSLLSLNTLKATIDEPKINSNVNLKLEEIINYLQKANLNKKIKLEFILDEYLIKGIKVKINNQVFDQSIANKIKQLKDIKFLFKF